MSSPGVQDDSPWEVPAPLLFNAWKHHAGAICHRIVEAVQAGEGGLSELSRQMVVIGTELMDLYTGALSPAAIAERFLALLRAENRLEEAAFRAWIEGNEGYRVHTLDDESCWVLRAGDAAGRYVHVHPARWAPATRRVRANVLRTAILVLAYAGVHGGDPLDVALVNTVRGRYLGLSPMRSVSGSEGLGAVIELLRSVPA